MSAPYKIAKSLLTFFQRMAPPSQGLKPRLAPKRQTDPFLTAKPKPKRPNAP